MTKDVDFRYLKNSNEEGINFLSSVRIGDGGYDYYFISLSLDNNNLNCDVLKIANIHDFITRNKIETGKFNMELEENLGLAQFLLKTLWNYIDENNYTKFNWEDRNFKKVGNNEKKGNTINELEGISKIISKIN